MRRFALLAVALLAGAAPAEALRENASGAPAPGAISIQLNDGRTVPLHLLDRQEQNMRRLRRTEFRFDSGPTAIPPGDYCVTGLAPECLPATFQEPGGTRRHHVSVAASTTLVQRIKPPYHPPMQVNAQ